MSASPFLNTQAVETWDTWFRWREHGQLRDLTIDATWERVSAALAERHRDAGRPGYERRLFEAFRAWQLLPDERLLATAATSAPSWKATDLTATLNIASFVSGSGLTHAAIDYGLIEEIAALAVYALDDAARLAAPDQFPRPQRLRIGMIGIANAFALLGLDYDSDAARAEAQRIAKALACGCLGGSVALARDRPPCDTVGTDWLERAAARGYPHDLIEAARRYGLCYTNLTAIGPQPRLASFANDVADALDPIVSHADGVVASTKSTGTGLNGGSRRKSGHAGMSCAPVPAQLRMRAAVQPWIDERIDYPLLSQQEPDAQTAAAWNALAAELDQLPVRWRMCGKESGERVALAV